MEAFLEAAMESETVVDGILSQDLTQLNDMWEAREYAGPAVSQAGYIYKYDISVPVPEFEDMSIDVQNHLEGLSTHTVVVNWGHNMDGNQHLNIVTPGVFEPSPEVIERLEPFIFESVVRRGGSISAEHGLGQCKNNYLPMCKDEAALESMKSLRRMFDPMGIMNPGKFLPDE
jgi:FAD/FMN-containing dehydrogenase